MTKKQKPYDLVVGLGKSGQAMAGFLARRGHRVIATDLDPNITDTVVDLQQEGIEVQLGFHDPDTFKQARTLFVSPGISTMNPVIQEAEKKGVPVSGELELFSKHNSTPVVAVTGTNGKTTTTTLIAEMLEASGKKVFTGGNIGIPLLTGLMQPDLYDVMVVEISSFQLDTADSFSPQTGVLLNISPDHMDRYSDFDSYARSKWSLFKNQGQSDTAIINQRIDNWQEHCASLTSRVLCFPLPEKETGSQGAGFFNSQLFISLDTIRHRFDLDTIRLKGDHNRENMAAAALAALAAGADAGSVQKILTGFDPLPHRLEYVKTINHVDFYNDSKATNPDAVIRAVECFTGHGVVLVMGGREKETDLSILCETIKQSVKAVVAIGESRHKIQALFSPVCPVKTALSMKQAVEKAVGIARPGDKVLLAPACASFDMYKDYKARGNEFKKCVEEIKTAI